MAATVAQSVSKLSSSCNVVLSCLPSDEACPGHLYRTLTGVFANVQRGSLAIDPEHGVSRDLAATLETRFRARSGGSRRDYIGGAPLPPKNGLLTLFRGRKTRNASTALSRSFALSPRSIFILEQAALERRLKLVVNTLTGNRNAGDCRSRCTR